METKLMDGSTARVGQRVRVLRVFGDVARVSAIGTVVAVRPGEVRVFRNKGRAWIKATCVLPCRKEVN
jgi:hypothetical protein